MIQPNISYDCIQNWHFVATSAVDSSHADEWRQTASSNDGELLRIAEAHIQRHEGIDAATLAEWMGISFTRAFELVDALVDSGRIGYVP